MFLKREPNERQIYIDKEDDALKKQEKMVLDFLKIKAREWKDYDQCYAELKKVII